MSLEFNEALKMAEAMYLAYSASTNNKNFRGEEMPVFGDLPSSIKDAWVAAAIKAYEVSTDRAKELFVLSFNGDTVVSLRAVCFRAMHTIAEIDAICKNASRYTGLEEDIAQLLKAKSNIMRAFACDAARVIFHGEITETFEGLYGMGGETVPSP